jgi:hypothetical protein
MRRIYISNNSLYRSGVFWARLQLAAATSLREVNEATELGNGPTEIRTRVFAEGGSATNACDVLAKGGKADRLTGGHGQIREANRKAQRAEAWMPCRSLVSRPRSRLSPGGRGVYAAHPVQARVIPFGPERHMTYPCGDTSPTRTLVRTNPASL